MLSSRETFVVAIALKLVPGVLVKLNWNSPPASVVGLIRVTCVEPGEMSRIGETLGMPLTNTVASAKPAGKLVIATEINELVSQLMAERN